MIGIGRGLMAAAAACALTLAVAGPAAAALNAYLPPNYTFPDGSNGFYLQTHGGGDFNPGVLVGFNPQPDPPGDNTMINLGDPGDPLLLNLTDGGTFNFLIGLLDVGDGQPMPGDPAPMPNADGITLFHGLDGGHTIDIFMQFGGGAVGSWSWGAFNPQPDPPGDFAGGQISFAADPYMRFGMDIDGSPVTFSLATPEPETWALMITGFAGAGAVLRRARKTAAAAAA